VNVAAFLAQSLQESIHYNACDENSWDGLGGQYPLSNACGQLGQSYQDYTCSAEEAHMACEVDPNMEIVATTNAKWWGAPPPLFCGPKSSFPTTGYWNSFASCSGGVCDDYEGQKGGAVVDSATPNSLGRTDVEGCCWWGRGVIQTTGVCNFGKLNYYLGKRASDEGRDSAYPDIDFCRTPDAICSSTDHPELKWIAGIFYWLNSVQTYESQTYGFDYLASLEDFTDKLGSGFDPDSDTSFIDAVSGIVNRGCASLSACPAGHVHNAGERRANFKLALEYLGLLDGNSPAPVPSPVPVEAPVPSPNPVEAPVPSPVPAETPVPSPVPVETPVPSPVPAPTERRKCVGVGAIEDAWCNPITGHDMCAIYPGFCEYVDDNSGGIDDNEGNDGADDGDEDSDENDSGNDSNNESREGCVGRTPDYDEFCDPPYHDMCAAYPAECVFIAAASFPEVVFVEEQDIPAGRGECVGRKSSDADEFCRNDEEDRCLLFPNDCIRILVSSSNLMSAYIAGGICGALVIGFAALKTYSVRRKSKSREVVSISTVGTDKQYSTFVHEGKVTNPIYESP